MATKMVAAWSAEASKISGGLPTGNLLALHRTLAAVGIREVRVT